MISVVPSAARVAEGSSATATSHSWRSCSFRRMPKNPLQSNVNGPRETPSRARSESGTAPTRAAYASISESPSSTLARGDLAFHSSHTTWLKVSGVVAPERVSASVRCAMTEPEPRWERTSAMVHSRG